MFNRNRNNTTWKFKTIDEGERERLSSYRSGDHKMAKNTKNSFQSSWKLPNVWKNRIPQVIGKKLNLVCAGIPQML